VWLYGKFSMALFLGIIVAMPLHAQRRPGSADDPWFDPFSGNGRCREVAVMVTDSYGIGIMGAAITTDDSPLEMTADSRGIVAIPCRSLNNTPPGITVSASGYRTTRVILIPNANSPLEVRLDRRDPVVRDAGATITASELLPKVRKQSAQLQAQAKKALAAGDYNSAEQLLGDAMRLTPSTAAIANNLGIIALRRKDMDTAGKWFQKASEEAPYQADILGNLGLVRWMQQRQEESYRILLQAFSQGYESNLGNYILGIVGLEKGAGKDSVDHLKKVPPDRFPDRDLYLSIALRDCGKTEAADKTFQDFLRRHRAPFLTSVYR
jgi:hypothetical protein